jgi:hypothetical protein
MLVVAGAGVSAANKRGDTPLLAAVGAGKLGLAEMLISKGANVNAANGRGDTPLLAAVGAGKFELAEMLISKGANAEVLVDRLSRGSRIRDVPPALLDFLRCVSYLVLYCVKLLAIGATIYPVLYFSIFLPTFCFVYLVPFFSGVYLVGGHSYGVYLVGGLSRESRMRDTLLDFLRCVAYLVLFCLGVLALCATICCAVLLCRILLYYSTPGIQWAHSQEAELQKLCNDFFQTADERCPSVAISTAKIRLEKLCNDSDFFFRLQLKLFFQTAAKIMLNWSANHAQHFYSSYLEVLMYATGSAQVVEVVAEKNAAGSAHVVEAVEDYVEENWISCIQTFL